MVENSLAINSFTIKFCCSDNELVIASKPYYAVVIRKGAKKKKIES